MRLLFAGTPEIALPSLRALLASQHEVVAVLTRPDAPAGRGRNLEPSPVRVAAEQAGLPVLTDKPTGPEFLAKLADLNVDAACVVAYGELLKPETLAALSDGWINLHFSVLPAWRGAAPVQRAVIAGDEITGATTFIIDAGMDTGPILGVVTEPVHLRDTAGDLLQRLSQVGARLLVDTIDAYDDGVLVPVPQSSEGVSRAPKITVEEAFIDFTEPAAAVDRKIRGLTPDPGAWTNIVADGIEDRLGLGPAALRPEVSDLAPGQLRATKNEVLVGTATHAIALGEVKPPGKRHMAAADWARGARLPEGTRLGR